MLPLVTETSKPHNKKMSQKRIIPNTADNSVTVRLRGVRLSFPSLYKPRAFQEGGDAKYSSTFIMPKKGDPEENATFCDQGVKEVIKMAFKGRNPGADKLCYRDGATKEDIDGYGDEVMFISSNSAKKVPVVDRDLTPLGEEDGKPYAGCYVNATVRLWAQDNKYGKRVNAQLRAVQFIRDGEPFGDSSVNPEEEFKAEDSEDML